MKELFKKVKWDSIIISILTIVLGILCVALPKTSGDAICIVLGCSLISVGFLMFVRFFAYEHIMGEYIFILAVLTTILGVFCLVYPNSIKSIVTVLFGLYIVVDSAVSLSDSMNCARAGIKGWFLLFILSLLTACLGIVVMFSNFETVMIFAGISLIVGGVRRMIITLTFSKKIRDAKKKLIDDQEHIYVEEIK